MGRHDSNETETETRCGWSLGLGLGKEEGWERKKESKNEYPKPSSSHPASSLFTAFSLNNPPLSSSFPPLLLLCFNSGSMTLTYRPRTDKSQGFPASTCNVFGLWSSVFHDYVSLRRALRDGIGMLILSTRYMQFDIASLSLSLSLSFANRGSILVVSCKIKPETPNLPPPGKKGREKNKNRVRYAAGIMRRGLCSCHICRICLFLAHVY